MKLCPHLGVIYDHRLLFHNLTKYSANFSIVQVQVIVDLKANASHVHLQKLYESVKEGSISSYKM